MSLMGGKRVRLFQRAKSSPFGWKATELKRLYKKFGFIIEHGSEHDIAKHPEFLQLRATITRSSGELHPDYVRHAVKTIEKLMILKGEENG